jgi:hypothetical protein
MIRSFLLFEIPYMGPKKSLGVFLTFFCKPVFIKRSLYFCRVFYLHFFVEKSRKVLQDFGVFCFVFFSIKPLRTL